MRAFYFMKIDYIITRKQMYLVPFFFFLALMLGNNAGMEELSPLVACSYLFFVSTIFSTAPFAYCVGKNKGFLLLFPATVKDRVAGRFLFGLSFVGLLGVFCGILVGVNMLFGVRIPLWTQGILLCGLASGIVLMALEFLFFYLFGEGKDNWQYLSNIVRVAPGMSLFFIASNLSSALEDAAASGMGMELEAMSRKFMLAGLLAVAAALLLTVAAAAVCVKVIEKRDYA